MKGCACLVILLLLCSFYSIADAAVFDVINLKEQENALNAAEGNGQNDTINFVNGTYNLTSTLVYLPAAGENYDLKVKGESGWKDTILDGSGVDQKFRIDTTAVTNDSGIEVRGSDITFRDVLVSGVSSPGGGFLELPLMGR
ncbi:MAG TPA: hypothetical protein QF571_11835 [Desulfobacterales bacterium]|jgi:hypothetical protein|nr:hypothetical protein [Desulfobacterales bacterium]HJO63496.1 hypothetical protein [Desulfobacterales bacterium]|tara:strand:- start:167 stop:592 length:426 start_codon:yes stop_codon:yes gene_type:complete